jgi:hypothetical protein
MCTICADTPVDVTASVAGASARARGEELRDREDERRRLRTKRRPILGRLANVIEGQPTAGRSWLKGAVGEEQLGSGLDKLADQGLLTLHDRQRPGTKANIDHLVVAASGVWVIDAKRYSGVVTKIDKGGLLRSDTRVTVGGRDRTKLVQGVNKQVADVRRIVAESAVPEVRVHGALCFVDAEFRLFAKPFTIDDVLITWGKALRDRMVVPGQLDAEQRAALHRHLAASLPPAK